MFRQVNAGVLLLVSSVVHGNGLERVHSDVANQEQRNSITNSNTAQSVNQMLLNPGLYNAPENTIGVNMASCASDFVYLNAGASRANLRNIDTNVFGDGSEAFGVQGGYVHVIDNDRCLEYQRHLINKTKTEVAIGVQVGCLRFMRTLHEEGVADSRPFIKVEPGLRKACLPLANEYYKNPNNFKFFDPNKHYGEMDPAPPVEAPRYEMRKKMVGWNQYRLWYGNFQSCGCLSDWRVIRENLMAAGVPAEEIYIQPAENKHGDMFYSVNIVRDTFVTHAEATKANQVLMVMGIPTKIRGMFNQERYKEVRVRIN